MKLDFCLPREQVTREEAQDVSQASRWRDGLDKTPQCATVKYSIDKRHNAEERRTESGRGAGLGGDACNPSKRVRPYLKKPQRQRATGSHLSDRAPAWQARGPEFKSHPKQNVPSSLSKDRECSRHFVLVGAQ
jgi:hypothetical protein